MKRLIVASVLLLILAGAISLFSLWQMNDTNGPPAAITPPIKTERYKQVKIFAFDASVPESWETEKVAEIDAVNLNSPQASEIFIRYFRASTFLTLPTVNILQRKEHQVGRRDAVTYLIEKKSGTPDFPYQPFWRNQKHRVTDIKGDDNTFYVFAKRPDLTEEIFEKFLASLSFVQKPPLSLPITNFKSRITKKGFGLLVSSGRFRGYHTGADAEVLPEEENAAVPVFTIADGEVILSQTTPGYGGVVVIKHVIDNRQVFSISGHLDPKSLAVQGKKVAPGEKIGLLGKADTSATDFERKHLHFGFYTGPKPDLRGYVENKDELTLWLDPTTFF